MAKIMRSHAAYGRIGVGKTLFNENYVDRGGNNSLIPGTDIPRLRPVPLGPRAVGFFDDELDGVIEALRRRRDATPRTAPKPAIDIALRGPKRTASKLPRSSIAKKICSPGPKPMSRPREVSNSPGAGSGTMSKRDVG
jgi:hypothetical protein